MDLSNDFHDLRFPAARRAERICGVGQEAANGQDAAVMERFRATLEDSALCGEPCSLDALARRLVPRIDEVRVKRLPLSEVSLDDPIPPTHPDSVDPSAPDPGDFAHTAARFTLHH